MGKRLIQQRRGRGTKAFTTPSFRYRGNVKILNKSSYKIIDLVRCPGHSAPLIEAEYDDGSTSLLIAPEGVAVGEHFQIGPKATPKPGNILPLKYIPEGTQIFSIEAQPTDGGKFVRSSGGSARVVGKNEDAVTIRLPSKKTKDFNPNCRAIIGTIAGGGRVDKPILKAGKKHHIMKSRNKYWPIVSGNAMNAVSHPFGNSRSLYKSKSKPAPKNAPPGRKVGMLRPRRSGKRNK